MPPVHSSRAIGGFNLPWRSLRQGTVSTVPKRELKVFARPVDAPSERRRGGVGEKVNLSSAWLKPALTSSVITLIWSLQQGGVALVAMTRRQPDGRGASLRVCLPVEGVLEIVFRQLTVKSAIRTGET
jgi:hypothetical protein